MIFGWSSGARGTTFKHDFYFWLRVLWGRAFTLFSLLRPSYDPGTRPVKIEGSWTLGESYSCFVYA